MAADTRDTPVTYSREEATQVRDVMKSEDLPLICPRCGGELAIGDPVAGGGTIHPVWEIRCLGCHRSAYVTEVSDRRRPK